MSRDPGKLFFRNILARILSNLIVKVNIRPVRVSISSSRVLFSKIYKGGHLETDMDLRVVKNYAFQLSKSILGYTQLNLPDFLML